jgi:hypothetical protein
VVVCAVCCGIRGPPISQSAAVVEAYLLLRVSMLRLYEIISGPWDLLLGPCDRQSITSNQATGKRAESV